MAFDHRFLTNLVEPKQSLVKLHMRVWSVETHSVVRRHPDRRLCLRSVVWAARQPFENSMSRKRMAQGERENPSVVERLPDRFTYPVRGSNDLCSRNCIKWYGECKVKYKGEEAGAELALELGDAMSIMSCGNLLLHGRENGWTPHSPHSPRSARWKMENGILCRRCRKCKRCRKMQLVQNAGLHEERERMRLVDMIALNG